MRLLDTQQPDIERIHRAMKYAVEQTQRSGEIIRRLRSFGGRGETTQQPETVAKLMEEASALALVGMKERGVTVRLLLDPMLPQVLADRVQVQQVLLNLLRNAVDAMETSARRELTLRAERWDRMVAISVADTGSGIPPRWRRSCSSRS